MKIKKKSNLRIIAAVILISMITALFTVLQLTVSANTVAPEEPILELQGSVGATPDSEEEAEDAVIYVSSIEEFVELIQNNPEKTYELISFTNDYVESTIYITFVQSELLRYSSDFNEIESIGNFTPLEFKELIISIVMPNPNAKECKVSEGYDISRAFSNTLRVIGEIRGAMSKYSSIRLAIGILPQESTRVKLIK